MYYGMLRVAVIAIRKFVVINFVAASIVKVKEIIM